MNPRKYFVPFFMDSCLRLFFASSHFQNCKGFLFLGHATLPSNLLFITHEECQGTKKERGNFSCFKVHLQFPKGVVPCWMQATFLCVMNSYYMFTRTVPTSFYIQSRTLCHSSMDAHHSLLETTIAFFCLNLVSHQMQDRLHTPSSKEPLCFG